MGGFFAALEKGGRRGGAGGISTRLGMSLTAREGVGEDLLLGSTAGKREPAEAGRKKTKVSA